MTTNDTLLSVVIPTYNYSAVLSRAVQSVVNQLGADCELLVIDDGSTDDTAEVVRTLECQYPGLLRAVRKDNAGAASARNLGIDLAKGAYLIFLDADDELAHNAISLIREYIGLNPQARFIAGGHVSVSADGRNSTHLPGPIPEQPLARLRAYLLDKKLALSNGACVMHRDVFIRGRYPEFFRSAEDIPVFAQVLANEVCTTLDTPLARIHKHADSLRHQFSHARAGGLALVDEVFSASRVGQECMSLKKDFYVQRCLSLFRTANLAGENQLAREYFTKAVKADWHVLLRASYSRKALRMWMKS
jgi:glycosyltransferase involved in cell wall biosynthesis